MSKQSVAKAAPQNKPPVLFNPFPGLRPFSMEESHLFFGREGQSDEVLLKLSDKRFVAIIGPSGSGKSSFVYCGVLPILYGGFLENKRSKWNVVVMRPGGGPIDNLADALLQQDHRNKELDPDEKRVRRTIVSTLLRSSSLGLVEAVQKDPVLGRKNVLVLVDQFEELFRFQDANDEGTKALEEALAFVKLLTEAVSSPDVNIYVSITMRSDFIGECAQFPELTQLINDSHYLIPQMTRDQKRMAVEGPVAVGGGRIAPRLVQTLLNDLGDKSDQLPILQHALMRTWDYWERHREGAEPIDLHHYEAIGRMAEALSQHANEAYDELSERQKEICEHMFKALTEKRGENDGIRRPTSLADIAAISWAQNDEVAAVVEKFRAQGRSLLMPPPGVPLEDKSIVDISHESLMRIWTRLRHWVDDEADAAAMYNRLAEAAAMYQVGKAGLWRMPDLQLAINWELKHRPTLVWGRRYHPAFERTMTFLEYSKQEYEEEQKIKELQQKRALRRARTTALVLGSATIISVLFLTYAFVQKVEADRRTLEATEARAQSDSLQRLSVEEAQRSDSLRRMAELEKLAADSARQNALVAQEEALYEKDRAEAAARDAEYQRQLADSTAREALAQKNEADNQRTRAESLLQQANIATDFATAESRRADSLRILGLAQGLAVSSQQIYNNDTLQGLLARQAFLFNQQQKGSTFNPDIYNGLYYALKKFEGDSINRLPQGHGAAAVKTVAYSKAGLFTAGADGQLLQWAGGQPSVLFKAEDDVVNRKVITDPSGRWLLLTRENGEVLRIDLRNKEAEPQRLTHHKGAVWDVAFVPKSTDFVTVGADNTLQLVKGGKAEVLVKSNERMRQVSIDPTGVWVAGAMDNGVVYAWQLSDPSERETLYKGKAGVQALSYSPNGDILVLGTSAGEVIVVDTKTGQPIRLPRHLAMITDVAFNDSGTMVATSSLDGSVKIWEVGQWNNRPLEFRDHGEWVWEIAFNPSGNVLMASGNNGLLKRWPLTIETMADALCGQLSRNMSDNEWAQYVGTKETYQETCESKPKGE